MPLLFPFLGEEAIPSPKNGIKIYRAWGTKLTKDQVVPSALVAPTRTFHICRAMFPEVKVNVLAPTVLDPAATPQSVALHWTVYQVTDGADADQVAVIPSLLPLNRAVTKATFTSAAVTGNKHFTVPGGIYKPIPNMVLSHPPPFRLRSKNSIVRCMARLK